jgi:hypothetical protein
MEHNMILFLDYDGVLHPDPCTDAARLFERAPRLAEALEPFPEVGIVLSTAWRTARPAEELLDPLPAALRSRVLGMNPKFSDCIVPAALVPYRRQAECEHWLHLNGMQDLPWWALDDRPEGFIPYCENLVECRSQRGFDNMASARLASLITLARHRVARGVDLLVA